MNEFVGRQFDNFRIDAPLGAGGMGAVYRAYDLALKRTVAIKFMHPYLAEQPKFREDFLREATLSAELGDQHDSVVRVHHLSVSKEPLYIVMAYVSGGSLAAHIRELQRKGEVVQLREILFLMAQVADALGFAHRHAPPVIHRDIKPSNILLQRLKTPEREGEPPLRAIVTDFGLAKVLEGSAYSLTGVTGTYAYMAPEQALQTGLDGRSDIYSLGVMLYQLTTGRLPLEIQSATDAVLKHQRSEAPPAPRAVWPDLPESVEAIILKAIAGRPEDRYQKAEAMVQELRAAANGLTAAEVTRFVQQRTEVSLATRRIALDEIQKPSQMGFELSPTAYGDRLIIAQKDHTPRIYPLDRDEYTLGRSDENDIVLKGEGISRQHARIRRTGASWQVIDSGSTNGTFLEEVRLLADVPQPWSPGTTLRMGPYFIHWQPAEGNGPPPPPAPPEGQIAATVTPLNVEIEAGSRADFEVKLFNQGIHVDQFNLRVEGLAAAWVRLARNQVELNPGKDAALTFSLLPPRDSSAEAGDHPFRLVVSSANNPQETAAFDCRLTIKPFEQFTFDLQPSNLSSGKTARVQVHNQGNQEAVYSIVGHDSAEAITFQGGRGRLKIARGKSETVDLTLNARRRPLLGSSQKLPFEVQVRSDSGDTKQRAGQLEVTPILPRWVAPAFVIFLALCFASTGLAYFGWFVPSNQANTTRTAFAIAARHTDEARETEAAQETQRAITGATQTAEAYAIWLTGDDDRDRLTNSEELDHQTFPDQPDSDQDGIVDGDEVKDLGTDPIDRDSDDDGLTDGDELTMGIDPKNPDTDGDGMPDNQDPVPGQKPTDTPTPTLTATPTPTSTSTPMPSPTPTDTPTPTPTPLGGGQGLIAFFSTRTGDSEIFLMNVDGSGVTNLTDNPADDMNPTWSPDGERIAFSSNRDGNDEIYVMNVDGDGLRRLTNNPASDLDPVWSPDGTHILFWTDRDGNREIYIMNADGSNPINLTRSPNLDFAPVWSTNGDQIGFRSHDGTAYKYFVMNATGSGLTEVTNNPAEEWGQHISPDGEWILREDLGANPEILLVKRDGSQSTNLTNDSGEDFGPAWQP